MGDTSEICACGRLLDWSMLNNISKEARNATISCAACNSYIDITKGIKSAQKAVTKRGKGKVKEDSNSTLSERYSYGRLWMTRLPNKYVYNPLQGTEMRAPKYSGMLFILGPSWFIPFERRLQCFVCTNTFSMFIWRYHCGACGEVVCATCSKTMRPVMGHEQPQRICDRCVQHSSPTSTEHWGERFFAIQSGVLYLRNNPILEEQAKGSMDLLTLLSCAPVSDVTFKAETTVLPPPGCEEYCFKAVFQMESEKETKYFCAKNAELFKSWITAITESHKERQSLDKQSPRNIADLHSACKKANANKVKELLKANVDTTSVDKNGVNALMFCARSTLPSAPLCATLILQQGTSPNAQDYYGKTALHWSVPIATQEDGVMDVLMRYGADLSVEDSKGLTPWEFFSAFKLSENAKKLLEYDNNVLLTVENLQKMLERGGSPNWRDRQGNSLLHRACLKKDVQVLRFLIENRVYPNMTNLYGHAALHMSCLSQFTEGIRLLLEHKASINIQDNMGFTALQVAVIFNVHECVEVLLNYGADPNIQSYPQSGSMTALHVAACLGYQKCAELLLDKGCDPNKEDHLGQTPHTIAKRYDTPILPMLKKYTDLHKIFLWCQDPARRPDIEQILDKDSVIDVNWPNGEKMTMLHIATIHKNLPVVDLLLGRRANFDLADCYGNTAVDIANGTEKTARTPSSKNEKIHQRFLQYRRINALNDFILRGSLPDVKRLLKESPTEYNLHVHEGMAPLHIAAQHGYIAICKKLMKGGAKVKFLSSTGKTPIHIAAEHGHVDCLKLMLDDPAGKNVVNLGDANGYTPLLLCITKAPKTLVGVCDVLLAYGAEVEQKNRDGENALDIAERINNKKFIKILTKHRNAVAVIDAARRGDSKSIAAIFELQRKKVNVMKQLIGTGTTKKKSLRTAADFQDMHGKTALHYACASQEGETCVSILLRNGAHVEIRDNDKKTPLDILRERQHTERTQQLLTQYAAGIQVQSCALSGQKQRMQQLLSKFSIDVDFCDQIEMKTPLHWACVSGYQACVEFLLKQGAMVDAKDKNSETPLFLAVRNGHKSSIEVLLEWGANPQQSNATGKRLRDCVCDDSEVKDQLRHGLGLFAIMNLLNLTINANEEEDVKRHLENLFERLEQEQTTLVPEILALLKKHIKGRKFVELAEKGDLARLRDTYQKSPEVLNYRNASETALHRAVRRGFVDLVQELLEQGALVDVKNNAKQTAVDIAKDMLANAKKDAAQTRAPNLPPRNNTNNADTNNSNSEGGENTTTSDHKEDINSSNPNIAKYAKILQLVHVFGCGPKVIQFCHDGADEKLSVLLKENIPLGFDPNYKYRADFTGLHVAASNGHLKCINILLEHKADANEQDADGFTPLHYAARWGKEEEVKRLLEAGVDIEQRNDQHLTPLMMAAIGKHNTCVQMLTTWGANVNVQNNKMHTPLMLAVLSGFSECVQLLLDRGALPNLYDSSKNTALHYATIHGHVDIIKLLLAVKDIDPNMENRQLYTPLIIATAKGNTTLLNVLLSSKATDPNYGSKLNPLFVAVHNSNVECLKILLEHGANPNKRIGDEFALHRAVIIGKPQIIELLLLYDADPLAEAVLEKKNVTPLDLLIVSHAIGQKSVPIQQLRCKAGANSIHEAIMTGEITALTRLLEMYSSTDVVNYQDRNGQTPLHWACSRAYASCVKALLAYYPNLYVKDKEGNVPMVIARRNENEEIYKELEHYENGVKLIKAATDGDAQAIQALIEGGNVDLHFCKPDKNTALHWCAAYGFTECVQLLLIHAPQLASRPNAESQLPIQLATERGHLAVVQELMPVTKPGGKAMHEDLFKTAVGSKYKDLVTWLHGEFCSHMKLPATLFPTEIEIEYRMGETVNFITVQEDITLYDLEKRLFNKLKRWVCIEQKIAQGQTQILDDEDLRKAFNKETVDSKTNKKTVVFYCKHNLENKPVASPSSATGPSADKPSISKKWNSSSGQQKPEKEEEVPKSDWTPAQFKHLKEVVMEAFLPHQKYLDKSLQAMTSQMKNSANMAKIASAQISDVYDEIQGIKNKDRSFVSSN